MKIKHKLGLSRLVTSHIHLKIAERIGETDGIKALDRIIIIIIIIINNPLPVLLLRLICIFKL